jgi:hypothetical protein
MSIEKKTLRIVGALFITATVASVVGFQVVLSPILNDSNIVTAVAGNDTRTIIGVLIDAINSVAVVAIAVLLFPIIRERNEALASGYLASRIIESAILIVGHISLLSLVTVSQQFVKAGPDASHYLALGTLLVAVSDWTFLLGPGIIFSITALILNRLLYKANLVPRWLSAWGIGAATLLMVADLLAILGLIGATSPVFILLFMPMLTQEMVFAVWIMTKGFNMASAGQTC